MKHKLNNEIESYFRDADAKWWNPNCGHDNRFWMFKAQSEYIRKQLLRHACIIPGTRALDAGCGRGIHSKLLRDIGCKVTSIDISPRMLYLTGRIVDSTLIEGNLMNMPFSKESFDIVVSVGTSMHVPSVYNLVSEIHRVLNTKGCAVMSMSNRLSLYVLWTTRINRCLVEHQMLYHRAQSTFWNFRKILHEQGFDIICSAGFAVIPPISLKKDWQGNIISPLVSKILSWPFDRILGRYLGCGVTFIVRKL